MNGKTKTLDVYIAGTLCGQLAEDRHGRISFEYDPNYCGVPLSLSMPIGLGRYDDRAVRPFLMGLLPDEASTRGAIGAKFGVSGNNPFRLLEIIGLDCPGAVQICPPNVGLPTGNSAHDLVELSENDIEEKLAAVRHNAAAAWGSEIEPEGRWSLAGCQAKFALRAQSGRWFECTGASATTYIMKPGVVGLSNQALVEHLSMKTASATGLPVAKTDYRFILYLFFNYLIGATDAHAKNHSFLLVAPNDMRLAPLYDVASIAPYQSLAPTKRKPIRAALSIGGENRFGMLKQADIEKMARDCRLDDLDLDADLLCEKLVMMANIVPDALRAVIDDAQSRELHGIDKVASALQSEIEGNCKRTLSGF